MVNGISFSPCDFEKRLVHRSRSRIFRRVKLSIFSYTSIITSVLGAQKNRLVETVLLSTHNIRFA